MNVLATPEKGPLKSFQACAIGSPPNSVHVFEIATLKSSLKIEVHIGSLPYPQAPVAAPKIVSN